jgi:hypothetical protein
MFDINLAKLEIFGITTTILQIFGITLAEFQKTLGQIMPPLSTYVKMWQIVFQKLCILPKKDSKFQGICDIIFL